MFCGRQILYDAEVSTPGKLAASCRFVYEMLGQGLSAFALYQVRLAEFYLDLVYRFP